MSAMAIGIGLTISFWLDCMLSGRNADVVNIITSSFIGHYQVYRKDFFEERSVNKTTDFDFTVLEKNFPQTIAVTSRYYLPSLVSSGESSYPVILQGIIPSKEKEVSTVLKSVKQGEILTDDGPCSPGDILIGEKLSQSLKVGLGEKIVILTQAADGSLGNDLFRVKGLFDTGSQNFDKSYVFVNQSCAQSLGSVDRPHEIVISVKESGDEEQLLKKLQAFVTAPNILVSWEEAVPAVARMIKVNGAIMGMVSFIVLIVVILGFVNTLLMSVFERTKEIGMMLTIGFSPGEVRLLLVFEALIIGLLASAFAVMVGSLLVLYHKHAGFDLSPFIGKNFDVNAFSFSLIIYPIFSVKAFLKVIVLSLVIVIVAVLFPAYRASRLSPLEVLRA